MYFKNQKYLVAGMSKSGAAAVSFLLKRGAQVYMYDDVAEGTVQKTMAEFMQKGAVAVQEGEIAALIKECDVLVLSPGIPIDHSLPVAFRKAGKRIIGESELGCLEQTEKRPQ